MVCKRCGISQLGVVNCNCKIIGRVFYNGNWVLLYNLHYTAGEAICLFIENINKGTYKKGGTVEVKFVPIGSPEVYEYRISVYSKLMYSSEKVGSDVSN